MKEALKSRVGDYLKAKEDLDRDIKFLVKLMKSQQDQVATIKAEQDLAVESQQALKDARPLLAQSAIKQAEDLANSALAAIFDFPAKLVYSEEDGRFFIDTPEGEADLQEGTGGGVQVVVSFIFQISLLVKAGGRMFMAFDEQFTQLSDEPLHKFIEFVNRLCESLNLDIILISHDARITEDMVTRMYHIQDGTALKIK